MYTIYSDFAGRSFDGDTLEDLRTKLVEFHFANRLDPQFGDFIDQYYAVYPLDESELDEGETVTEPRPLTKDLLIQLAQHIWDTPHVELKESTDITALADTLHYLYDMDTAAARDILRDYIEQLENYEGRPIDEDEISRDDADFLIESVKSARTAGDLGSGQFAALEESARLYQRVAASADDLRSERDKAIMAALAAGASKAAVARATGISRQAVDKIVRRMQG